MIAKTLIAAAAVASFAAAPAFAEPFAFRYKSFELDTTGGRAAMMARLDRSIERHCDAGGVRSIAAQTAAAQCREELKHEVMAKIDNVEFAALGR
jgi:UrcA family protein